MNVVMARLLSILRLSLQQTRVTRPIIYNGLTLIYPENHPCVRTPADPEIANLAPLGQRVA